jgi:tetratricopeptide (TPR) repeat protein
VQISLKNENKMNGFESLRQIVEEGRSKSRTLGQKRKLATLNRHRRLDDSNKLPKLKHSPDPNTPSIRSYFALAKSSEPTNFSHLPPSPTMSSTPPQHKKSFPCDGKTVKRSGVSFGFSQSSSQLKEEAIIIIDSDNELPLDANSELHSTSLDNSHSLTMTLNNTSDDGILSSVETSLNSETLSTLLSSSVQSESESQQLSLSTHETFDLDISNDTIETEKSNITDDVVSVSSTSQSKEASKPLVHYYLRNFFIVLDIVCTKDHHLFTENELQMVNRLRCLSESAQRLFVRLFNRKGPWFQIIKLKYQEIPNIQNAVDELVTKEFAVCVGGTSHSQIEVSVLIELLELFTTEQLIQVFKRRGGDVSKTCSRRRQDLIARIESNLRAASCPQLTLHHFLENKSLNKQNDREHWGREIVQLLGPCVRLTESSLVLFRRIHRLFFLNRSENSKTLLIVNFGKIKYPPYLSRSNNNANSPYDPNKNLSKCTQLTDEMNVISVSNNNQDKNFPKNNDFNDNIRSYKPTSVFASREDLERYETSLLVAEDLTNILGMSFDDDEVQMKAVVVDEWQLELAHSADFRGISNKHTFRSKYNQVTVQRVLNILQVASEGIKYETHLYTNRASISAQPDSNIKSAFERGNSLFLLRFSAGWVYASVLTVGVSFLEKMKDFHKAIEYLELLLDSPYCPNRRGHWWNRLALNFEHIGRKDKAIEICLNALQDHTLSPASRYTIEKRLDRLWKPPLKWTKKPEHLFTLLHHLKSPKEIYIQGCPIRSETGRKNLFLGYDEMPCSVEELALQFYKFKENWEGIHCEGEIFVAMFTLLFWDIIFCVDIPHVFQTPYQDAPLDLATECFYISRKEMIEERLALIHDPNSYKWQHQNSAYSTSNKEIDESNQLTETSLIESILQANWTKYYGTLCRGVNWERLNIALLVTVAHCVGGEVLATICRTLAQNYRHATSGFPDLVLWNPTTKKAKFSEVKGPRDCLSEKQRIWIHILMSANADVEIIHIKEKVLIANRSDDSNFDMTLSEMSTNLECNT